MKEKRLKKMKTTLSRIDKDKSFYEVFFNILHFTILEGCLKQCGCQILHLDKANRIFKL